MYLCVVLCCTFINSYVTWDSHCCPLLDYTHSVLRARCEDIVPPNNPQTHTTELA